MTVFVDPFFEVERAGDHGSDFESSEDRDLGDRWQVIGDSARVINRD